MIATWYWVSIPSLYSKTCTHIGYSNCEPRDTELLVITVHVDLVPLLHFYQASLQWIVDTTIDFDPHPFHTVVLKNE